MPAAIGGEDSGPTPGWLLRTALASCAVTRIAMEAASRGITLHTLEAHATSRSDLRGLVGLADADLTLPDRIAQAQPDMVIVASESAARDTIEHVCVATQHAPRPIVLFTDNDDAARIKSAFAAGITAYIVDGIKPTRVKAVLDVAYARFEHERELRAELDTAKTQLAERKVLERAKGLLMKQMNLSEDEAFKRLRKMAMDRNIKLVEAAQRVIDVMAG
jgi:response regulator NasT